MPKNSALLNEIESVLKIYYDANDWLENSVFKDKLKSLIGDGQYSSSYTKKAQITSYFGFTVWENINNSQSLRKITAQGKKFYEALIVNDKKKINKLLMESLENTVFGRNNYGCPESDTDVEPPCLFIRGIIDLGYLTYKEFAYMLFSIVDEGKSYTDIIKSIKESRNQSENIVLSSEANKYADCKPIMMLIRWGFLQEVCYNGENRVVINNDVFEEYKSRLRKLAIYNVDKYVDIREINCIEEFAKNIIYYGVPGSGKSHKINQICNELEFVERIVFHPDYSNADFIGQIMPVLQDEDNKLKYEFIPGPFSNILKRAIEDPNNMYYLVIEEINRGNAAAIFGDIFQLLDRDEDGKSKYCINNYYIADYVYGNKTDKIQLPSNLTIYATMNSSDQNVFTLDTAFQRRWIMKNVPNIFKGEQAGHIIGDTDIKWGAFAIVVNDRLQEGNIGLLSTEDKGLGAYFVNKSEIEDIRKFAEKVFKYLWDDAFKMNRTDLFKEEFKTLSDILNVCKAGDKDVLEKVLIKEVYDDIRMRNSEFISETTEA